MKRFKKKYFTFWLMFLPIGLLSFTVPFAAHNPSKTNNFTVTKTNSSTFADTKTQAQTNLIPFASPNKKPLQSFVFDSSNSSYALINSNTPYSAMNTMMLKPDNVTKFSVKNGSALWNINLDKLKPKNTSLTSATSIVFDAISYVSTVSNGDFLLAVLTDNNNSNYFAVINWNTGEVTNVASLTNSSSSKITMTMTITNNSTTSWFINVNLSLNLNVTILQATTSFNNSKYSLSLNRFNVFNLTTNSFNANQITLPTNLVNNNFSNNTVNYSLSNYYTYRNNLSLVFASNNDVTVIRLNTSNQTTNIDSSSFLHFNVTSSGTTPLNVTYARNNNTQYLVVLNNNNYLTYSFQDNNFGTNNINVLNPLSSGTLNNGTFLVSLTPLFGTNRNIVGYIGTLSNNSVVRFASDFSSVTNNYFDFNTLNTTDNNKKILNVFSRIGDTFWYGQLQDGSIINFSNNLLISQVSNTSNVNVKESLAKINFVSQNAISTNTTYAKVSDNNDNVASDSFKAFINSHVNEFLKINSSDLIFGQPLLSAEVATVSKINNTNNYLVTINFYQQLRTLNNGVVTNNGSKVLLGTNVYTFFNSDIKVTVFPKDQISNSLTSKIPSQITTKDLDQILAVENGANFSFTLFPNDSNGTLRVRLSTNIAYVNGKLTLNYSQDINIGTVSAPYFVVDQFNGLNTSIEPVTDQYLTTHATTKNLLDIKYSSLLPSQITKEEILNDFLIYGSAFANQNLIQNNTIIKPTDNDVSLIPVDSQGYLNVRINFPKIGSQTNVVYQFNTASVFRKNFSSDLNSFLIFKKNSDVLNTAIPQINQAATPLSSLLPSNIVSLIQNDRLFLLNFVSMSYDILNIINSDDSANLNAITLNLLPNDSLGTLQITITFNQSIGNLGQNTYTYVYSGFTRRGVSNAPTNDAGFPTFSWGTLQPNALANLTPSQVTPELLETSFGALFNENSAASSLSKKITTQPLDANGAVIVNITYFNWWTKQTINGRSENVLLPEKSFTTLLTNNLTSGIKEAINTIVWKSFSELSSDLTENNFSPSQLINSVNLTTNNNQLNQLKLFATLSDSLNNYLLQNPSSLSFILTPMDSLGRLNVFARININNTAETFQTTLSGFALVGNDYEVSLLPQNSDKVQPLLKLLPSQVTQKQIESLVNINIDNNLSKSITSTYNDANGTLQVTVSLFDPSRPNTIIATTSRTYNDFQINKPKYKRNNLLIILISFVVPFAILLVAILYVVVIKERWDIRKYSKFLQRRLGEEAKKSRHKKTRVNSVSDLLKMIDNKKQE